MLTQNLIKQGKDVNNIRDTTITLNNIPLIRIAFTGKSKCLFSKVYN